MRKKWLVVALLLSSIGGKLSAQGKQNTESKMDWFDDAKLGIFIHWGIYSVQGISESWSFFNNYISQENYLTQLNGFSAENYKPQEWARLIKESGAKYSVITTKHHDGIALWDSKAPESITIKKDSKAQRDVLNPYIIAANKEGLKTGLYFSLPDWSHPYYDIKTRTQKRYEISQDPKKWESYINYYQQQLSELSEIYNPDLLWFDGDWEHSSEEWQSAETLDLLRKKNKNIIINSRLNHHGDYETPEQGIPVKRPASRYWELCYTMNDSWGYQPFDVKYKSPNMIIRTLVECITMGGNLLLDIGPKADGTIPFEQVNILKELGRWTNKHKEAIYGTRAGIGFDFTTEKTAFSKDGKTLFIYLENNKNTIRLTNLYNKPTKIRVLGSSTNVISEYEEGCLLINLKNQEFDKDVTVLAVDFEDKPVFSQAIIKTLPTAEKLLNITDTYQSISSIVQWTSLGSNLFKGLINDDGSKLDKTLSFASEKVKAWVKKHAEILHNAQAGIDKNHYNGYSALSEDKQTLYLFVEGEPTGPIAIKGLKNTIARIRIVGEGSMMNHQIFNKLYWSATPGIVYIDIPRERLDKNMTVIAVLLDKPIELYTEEVKAIENNL